MPPSSSSTLPTDFETTSVGSNLSRSRRHPAGFSYHKHYGWSLCLLAIFALLLLALQSTSIQTLDAFCSTALHGFGGAQVTQASKLLAKLGSTGLYFMIPAMGIGAWLLGTKSVGGWANLKIYLGLLAGHCCLLMTKVWVARPRPHEKTLHRHFDSFPSGHTLIAMILAGSVLLFVLPHCRKTWQRITLWIATASWPLAMGLSRVQLGRHYLSDVIAAWLLGAALLLVFSVVVERTDHRQRGFGAGTKR